MPNRSPAILGFAGRYVALVWPGFNVLLAQINHIECNLNITSIRWGCRFAQRRILIDCTGQHSLDSLHGFNDRSIVNK